MGVKLAIDVRAPDTRVLAISPAPIDVLKIDPLVYRLASTKPDDSLDCDLAANVPILKPSQRRRRIESSGERVRFSNAPAGKATSIVRGLPFDEVEKLLARLGSPTFLA